MICASFVLGVGMLAKYAALYGLFGLLLIWAIGRHQPAPIIRGKYLLLALVAFFMQPAQI